jgi:probable selenium-dependent hydroxylase accessory protein YqeC
VAARMIPVPVAGVAEALGLLDGRRHHVALVGGGGKTTLMHGIADALPGQTVLTCTTKMGADQHWGKTLLVDPTNDEVLATLRAHERALIVGSIDGPKAVGILPTRADQLFAMGVNVVAESDGSRRRPAKAPHWYEPVLASTVDLVVCVIGADALDRTIEDQCHRPLLVGAVLGCSSYDRLTPERAAILVTSDRGGRKDVPATARFAVCVTKVNDDVAPLVTRFLDAMATTGVRTVAVAHHGGAADLRPLSW